jgi:hypothetical protein
VLPFRFALFAALGAIALWGLFSLLDNLKKPELLRSAQAVVLKGCDPVESDEARNLCAALRCQKALLDSKASPLRTRFQVEAERTHGEIRLITGTARPDAASAGQLFACVVEREVKVTAKLITPDELDALLSQESDWILGSAQ